VVTAKTQYNLKNAREYFEEHLCVGDYYNEGERGAGEWVGLGAERLGLSGKVRGDDFLRLCENQNPATGETLTQRLNTTRTEGDENTASPIVNTKANAEAAKPRFIVLLSFRRPSKWKLA
jgi:hypothetical protein